MPKIVKRAGFVISLLADSPKDHGADEWLETIRCIVHDEVLWRTRTIWTFCAVTLKSSWASLWISYLYAARKQGRINTHMNIGPSVNPPIAGLTNWKYGKQITIPRCRIIVAQSDVHRLGVLCWLLVLGWALVCPMFIWTTSKAAISIFVFLLTFLNGRRWHHHSNI